MDIFEWEDGTIVERPYVEINGTKYYVQDGAISGGTPATANNLNEMQNILNQNILDELYNRSKILWVNSNPTSNFNAQAITLNESLDNYDCYAIIFKQVTTGNRLYNTGQIPVGHGTICFYNASVYWYRPTSDIVSGSTITFEDAREVTLDGQTHVDNSRAIPVYVIGYKTGLF